MPAVSAAAIDLGATSGRVIVGTLDKGRLVLDEVHRFRNGFEVLGPHCYWNLPGLFAEVRRGLELARAKHPRLAACGVDTWGCDTALVDKRGRLVFPVHAYRDTRTERQFTRLAEGEIRRVYGWTGIPNLSYNTSLQLQELVERVPGIVDVADRALFLPDYLTFLLGGEMANEISVASTSQLLEVDGCRFSRKALRHFGIPKDWFRKPALAPGAAGTVCGIPGLEKVGVIRVPGHDTACAYDAMPSDDPADLYLSSGTWSLMGFIADAPVANKQAFAQGVCNERLGDGRWRPLRTCLGLWLLEQTLPAFDARPESAADWERLIAAAEAAPAPVGLLDTTDRALFNPASMREAIDAQLRAHGHAPPRDLAGYVRLICASLGAGHGRFKKEFEELTGRTFRRILIVGGGSRNRLLCQATADAAGVPVVSYNLEGTAVGNLANQFVALGAVADLRTFRAGLARRLDGVTYTPRG